MTSSSLNQQVPFTAVDFDPFAAGEVLLTAPATESQREIWASVQMGKDANCAYNESQSLRLRGNLDLSALQTALQALVERHESLRTTFSPDGVNLCITTSPIEIPVLDLSELTAQERSNQVAKQLQQSVAQPFDLEHGPLFRVEIIKLHPQEHLVLLTAHHIICDGWSWAVLIPDLGKLYSALKQGHSPDLEEPDRFSDYALTLEAEANSEEAIATEQYWLNQFSGSVPVVDFPTDRPRPPLRTFNSARQDYQLSPALASNLKQLGTQFGCSFMTTLLAGFEVFLYRLTGQTDLAIGISAAGQAATGQYNLVGHCVNLLPLRTQINPRQPFSDYLKSRKSTVLDAYDHQQFTFGRLIQKLSLPRDPSRIPLVPVTFNIDQGLDNNKLSFDGLKVEFFSNPRLYENFELYLNVTELDGKLILECQYNTNLFDAETIHRRLAELETLLTGISNNPNQLIADLPILPEIEQQLLEKWNQTQVLYPQNLCLHQLVEAQVERTPDAIAVVFENQQLTYRELNQRANQLAHYLREVGVNQDTPVGLCVERSLEMVVGMLGVLKAGGAYVPLDPEYPIARLTYMLENVQTSVLLTQQSLVEKLSHYRSQVIFLDQDWDTIAQYESQNPETNISPDNLAYIIYTSGSTGNPKGVMIAHQAICNHMNWMQSTFPLAETDRVLQKTPFSFDASIWEFYAPLLAGAQLILARPGGHKQIDYLVNVLVEREITVLQVVPALLQMLLEQSKIKACHSLKRVFCGGESLPYTLQTRFFATLNAALINLYGPTEACIDTTFCICKPLQGQEIVPIGQPVTNAEVYLLDNYLQPVPIGVTGELHISGAGLAKGYRNRPDLTAEKFISHSFNSDTTKRLYKTGDLARHLLSGNLEFLGRIDHQVKVRGFRIELGEVEATLGRYSGVRDAVVAVREDIPGDQRLVAYLVLNSDEAEVTSNLRLFLKQQLPDYMIPSIFVVLEALPLTPNGKVDRKALPSPDGNRLDLQERYVAPRNSIEQQMAGIWAQILNLERVGIHDNFFELGGHSLLAIQVTARSRQLFAVELSLLNLFEAPTVAELADRIETLQWITQGVQTLDQFVSYEEGEL